MSRRSRKEETAARILDAAVGLWAEKGYRNTTMREIARRVGMGTSSLYFHFASKEDLVQFLYDRINADVIEEFLRTDTGEADLGSNLQRFLRLKIERMRPHRSALHTILKEAADPESALSPLSRASNPTLQRNLDTFAEWVTRSGTVNEDDRYGLARLLWVVHIGVLVYWMHDRSSDEANSQALIDEFAGIIPMLPMATQLPGAARLLELMGALFEQDEAAAPREGSVTADDVPARTVDVVVVGGGPIGCLTAAFLKRFRPQTSVVILERADQPGHKIGESTLSGFCKALRTIGIRHEAQQRLFYPKNGLAFFHVDESTQDLRQSAEYILETFDETFQVERRVLDGLLIEQVRRLGIEVMQGARVRLDKCHLGADGNEIHYEIGGQPLRMGCRLVIDATGPGRMIATGRDLWSTDGLTFQTSATWSYWGDVRRLATYGGWGARAQFPRDEYTQHICFREGWLWYIPLFSWEAAPATNLGRLQEHVLDKRRLPSRADLSSRHGCPVQETTSIGLVIRNDRDAGFKGNPREAFDTYRERYPAIAQLLDQARLLEDPYGDGKTFDQRVTMRGYARQVAGDGWLLVGDAAFFVDPLISPGLTAGTATAWCAAEQCASALDTGVFREDQFAGYATYVRDLHDALERDNQLVYMSFNHPDALRMVQRFQEVDARRHFLAHQSGDYGADDTNVWGILDPAYQDLQRRAWACMREAESSLDRQVPVREQTSGDYDEMVAAMETVLGEYIRQNAALTPYAGTNAPDAD